ncbi:MAG TPA: hypothetical protein VKA48_00315 [Gammaproteobacteria bacterium]|nr:hypothetical protein [Gammaproteobacteria bacterium]
MKSRGTDVHKGPFSWGASFNPQRFVVGGSFGYWPCVWGPNVRVYLGHLRFWGAVRLKPKHKKARAGAKG